MHTNLSLIENIIPHVNLPLSLFGLYIEFLDFEKKMVVRVCFQKNKNFATILSRFQIPYLLDKNSVLSFVSNTFQDIRMKFVVIQFFIWDESRISIVKKFLETVSQKHKYEIVEGNYFFRLIYTL